MNFNTQEAYNEGAKWYHEYEKRLGLAKDDKDLLKELEEKKKENLIRNK